MHTHTHAHMHTRIYTCTYICTPAYTRTPTHTNERNVREQTHTPASPLHRNSSFHPPPRKFFANQLAVPTPTRTALINKLAYSHEYYPFLTEVPPLSLLSRTLSLTNVSPSHPGTAEPIHAVSHTLSLTDASLSHPRLADFQ
jgi:hypothetical protein